MVSKVASYYTTDEEFNVVSNNLDKVIYDRNSLTLWVRFKNQACYKYWGVPEHLYDGMMRSASHGVYFGQNIRQRFTYKPIPNLENAGANNIDFLSLLSKGNKRLNELDKLEVLVDKQFNDGVLSSDKYGLILSILKKQREKASDTLDKEMGVYVSPAQKRREERLREKELQENLAHHLAQIEQDKADKVLLFKKVGMGILVAGTFVFMLSHFLVGAVLLGIMVEAYRKI